VSTYIYLECVDHDPPLRADGESGQHLYDLPQIRADIADREALVRVRNSGRLRTGGRHRHDGWVDFGYFRNNTIGFLAAHPRCEIGIRDEYGQEHPLTEGEAP
jgi:hypothetical protein